MSQFIQAGWHWINLERVTSIELLESPTVPNTVVMARVHYSTGKEQDFSKPDEIKAIHEYLKTHRAH